MITLKIGATGKDVIRLQILLNGKLKPSPKLKADGDFGAKTKEAVLRLQNELKLTADGIVGKKTWEALGIKSISKPTVPTKTPNAPWYDIAQSEVGIKEIVGADKHNKRILEYHATTTLGAKTDEIPWCSSFVNWVMIQAGIKGTNNALAKSWENWGLEVKTPSKGVITVIKRKGKTSDEATGSSTGYHVGFYISSNTSIIRLLGGNQSDQVKESGFYLKSYEVVAYRKPLTTILKSPLIHELKNLSFYC
ncbi:hypothetical protein TDB9533_03009 [Thalassocella blandensis]|nr:hypothetical protein TDB9533_03009 [Thalassocella blandensis]